MSATTLSSATPSRAAEGATIPPREPLASTDKHSRGMRVVTRP
nr:hypothetical protein [uncultured Actinomyces sp.]